MKNIRENEMREKIIEIINIMTKEDLESVIYSMDEWGSLDEKVNKKIKNLCDFIKKPVDK